MRAYFLDRNSCDLIAKYNKRNIRVLLQQQKNAHNVGTYMVESWKIVYILYIPTFHSIRAIVVYMKNHFTHTRAYVKKNFSILYWPFLTVALLINIYYIQYTHTIENFTYKTVRVRMWTILSFIYTHRKHSLINWNCRLYTYLCVYIKRTILIYNTHNNNIPSLSGRAGIMLCTVRNDDATHARAAGKSPDTCASQMIVSRNILVVSMRRRGGA